MNPTPPTINTSPKSIDLMQNTSPVFNNPLLLPIITLRRIKTFKTIDFVKILGMTHMAGGWGSSCLYHYDALRKKIDV